MVNTKTLRLLDKVKAPTKRQLRKYLETHPGKLHVCGNFSQCVVADYFVDTLPEGVVGDVTVRTGGWSTSLSVNGQYVAGIQHPRWLEKFIEKFDDLPTKTGRVRSSTILKRLGYLLAS